MTDSSANSSTPLLLAELTQQLHQFFRQLDEYRYDDMVAMFTEDGLWLRQGQHIRGRAAIRDVLATRPAGQRIRHVMTNAFIAERQEGRVRLEAYMTAYRHENPPASGVPVITGPFRLNLVSTVYVPVNGQWLIAEQSMVPEFIIEPA
jgi:hypothetical protein